MTWEVGNDHWQRTLTYVRTCISKCYRCQCKMAGFQIHSGLVKYPHPIFYLSNRSKYVWVRTEEHKWGDEGREDILRVQHCLDRFIQNSHPCTLPISLDTVTVAPSPLLWPLTEYSVIPLLSVHVHSYFKWYNTQTRTYRCLIFNALCVTDDTWVTESSGEVLSLCFAFTSTHHSL